MDTITRKKNTGEPGNGGQFGGRRHADADITLSTAPKTPLSPQQRELLIQSANVRPVIFKDGSELKDHGLLVSGHNYRSALALERKGLARVSYQGPSLGWLIANADGKALVQAGEASGA